MIRDMTENNKKSELFLKKINEIKNISGFLNVFKHKSDNNKGFKWVYTYKKDGKSCHITSVHLFVLKYLVTSKNLPWEIIDESQAKKTIELEESKYYLYDNGSGILFVDIIEELYNPFKGFWHYKFRKNEFYDINLENLKRKVLKNHLPWIILNEKHTLNSFKKDLTHYFESGICMVNKIIHNEFTNSLQWVYVYEKNEKFNFIKSDDLIKLKNNIEQNGFIWKITDNLKYESSLNENNSNLKQIERNKWAFTGIHRVKKRKDERVLQGFLWNYRFKQMGNKVEFSSTDLNKLKEKVLKNKLEWKIIDETSAIKSFNENQQNLERFGFSPNMNKTGIYRVYKLKSRSKQGFYWVFSQKINKKSFNFSSVDLKKLKQKVIDNGFEWRVIDKKLAKKSFKENKENMKKYYS